MEDEIKTVEEPQESIKETPKKRGPKPKKEVAVESLESAEQVISEPEDSSGPVPDEEIDKIEDTDNNEIDTLKSDESSDEPNVHLDKDDDLTESTKTKQSVVVNNLKVYKTPNEKNYATSISGAVKFTDEDVNGFVPIEFKVPGQGNKFTGFAKYKELIK